MDIINNEKKSFVINNNKKLYPTIFKWEGQAEIVYLTGSFCDWLKFYEMEKIGNIFYFTLFLQKGTYQYKFKVDSNWKYNTNFPICCDKEGNINNLINIEEKKNEEITTDFSTSSISNNNNKDIDENIWDEFTEILNNNIICNNKSKNISNKSEKNFEGKDDINNYINYYSYKKKLLPIKNEFMEHLNIKKSINQKNNIKYTVTSCHIRVGLKITTFIYYKPKSM